MSKFTAWPAGDGYSVDMSASAEGETREEAITNLLEGVLQGQYTHDAVWTGNNKTFVYRLVFLDQT